MNGRHIVELAPILLLLEPIPTASGGWAIPFSASRVALEILVNEALEPENSVNLEVYNIKSKAGRRAPISWRLTGADAIQVGQHLVALGKECLTNERK